MSDWTHYLQNCHGKKVLHLSRPCYAVGCRWTLKKIKDQNKNVCWISYNQKEQWWKKTIKCRQTSHCQGRKYELAAQKINGSGSSLVCRHHLHLQPVVQMCCWINARRRAPLKTRPALWRLWTLPIRASVAPKSCSVSFCLPLSGSNRCRLCGTQGKLKQNSSPLGKTLNVPSLEGRDCSWQRSPSGHGQRMCCVTARTANGQQSQIRAITLQLKRNFVLI